MEGSELRAEVEVELSLTDQQLAALEGRSFLSPAAVIALLVLVALNIAAFLLSASYGPVWIAASLLVTLVLTVLALLPTTRSTAGIGGTLVPVRKLRNVRGSNKKVLAALLLSAFMVSGVPMVPGMIVLLGVSIAFALVAILTVPELLLPMVWIAIQSLLMISFFLWLMRLRPFSADFLEHVTSTVLRLRSGERALRTEIEFGLLIMSSAVVLIGVFILPGFSLKLVTMEAGSALLRYVVPFLIVMLTQMLIVRGWQVEESRRWARGFLLNKRNNLLRLRAEAENGQTDVEVLRERLLVTRIMRLQSHDLFGHLPIYSFFPDLDILLNRDLQDELACITPTDALRNTGF